jgi:hypothetical protein
MTDNTENTHGPDDREREAEQPLPTEPQAPSEPEPAGDPGTVQPANGGWGSQDIPVPAN